MRHRVAILLLLLSISIPGISQDFKGGLTFKRLFLDYQTFNEGSFDAFRDYTDGFEFSYIKPLTDKIHLNIPVKAGFYNTRIDETSLNHSILGLDAQVNYRLLDSAKRLQPYLLAGAGIVLEDMDSTNIQIPVGFGLDLMIAPNAFITWQSEVRFSTAENKNNLNHGIGFKYHFGGPKKEVEVKKIDSDQDGLTDDVDLCPLVPGLEVFNGCPDSDGDGIQDSEDDCPEYPGLPELNGCPDEDGDGIPDNEDECPSLPGTKERNGCPESDRDNDGVVDELDKCPDLAGFVALEGCPDADGDGVADPKDKCPEQAGPPHFDGCPDTDGDGIPDPDDLCPNTVGPAANKGCPEIKKEDKEVLEFAMQAVQFEHNSSVLRPESFTILNQVAEILSRYPDYHVEISGHTDNTGGTDYNQRLSESRAKSCFDYIASRGTPRGRMSYTGFGESKPIATNDTLAGRQLNRRVEFNLFPGSRK